MDSYRELVAELRRQADLGGALSLLGWDQETYLPRGALASRARQIGELAAVLHRRRTDPSFLGLVDELAADPARLDSSQVVDVRETKWRLDRARALDADLIRERSALQSEARGVWVEARQENDFTRLAPVLCRVVEMERRVAAAIDPGRDAYEVLLEGYEPGVSTDVLTGLLENLQRGLHPIVERLRARLDRKPLAASGLCGDMPIEAQRRFNRHVAERIGFDFERGRLDEAAHPSTITIGEDVRLTTRYDVSDLRYSLYSTIHEAGHGLYEQGLDPEAWGTPRGRACSLGVHESQSRLWENQVGRSEGFWRCFLPDAGRTLPALRAASLDDVVLAANQAGPSLIRTEADEITYNLHILLRVELERALIAGDLDVADLPAVWNEKMRSYLGVAPASDRDGVLQDVHWPSGAFGYFPTYTLGNLYAAQMIEAAERDLGPLEAVLAAGQLRDLLAWLRCRVHRLGQTHRPWQLVVHATGTPPGTEALLRHLQRKVAYLEAA